MAGINLEFAANVTKFLRGTGDVEKALGDVAGSLDDLARDAHEAGGDASKAIDGVGDSLDDLARDAQDAGTDAGKDLAKGIDRGTDEAGDAVERLQRSFGDMVRDASKQSKTVGDDLGDNVRRGTRDAGDGLDEFKREADSTAKETAASFDGSADSIAGAFQEVAANALGGFGPIGAAAGLALAAGVGKFWTDFQADAERAKQATADAFEDMIESGSKFLSAELVNQRIRDIITNNEDAATSYEHVQEVAERTGAEISLILRAYAGDQEAVNALIDATSEKQQAIRDKYDGGVMSKAALNDVASLQDVVNQLGGVQASTDEAAAKYDEYGRAARRGSDEAVDGAARARAEFDGLGRKIRDLPTEHKVAITADTTGVDQALAHLRSSIKDIFETSLGTARQGAIIDARYAAQAYLAEKERAARAAASSAGLRGIPQ